MRNGKSGGRTARASGRASSGRAFAVKGVFKYVWTYAKPRRMRKVWYESRVLRIQASTERLAKAGAHKAFKAESCASKWPAPDVASTEVRYIGISGLLDMDTELEPGELWWELLDERPQILEYPVLGPKKKVGGTRDKGTTRRGGPARRKVRR